MKYLFSLFFIGCIFSASFAQTKDSTDAVKKDSAKIIITGYVDGYYAHYTDSLAPGAFQKFPSVCPREGFGLNIAMVTASYDAEKVRGIASLMYGDIPASAWSGTFNTILEAHAGIRLCKTLWLDGGFFRTHFGTEGLLPKENIATSVSLTTFYEPYFESGFRLSYNPNDKLSVNAYLLNGYNIYEENNNKKSLGLLATYSLGDKGNIGYSNYTGDDTPAISDSIAHLRIHNNLFWNYQFGKLKTQIGGDYCMQQNSDTTGKKSAAMFSGVIGLKYQLKKKYFIYTREEIFNDPQGFMSGVFIDKSGKQTGLKETGFTGGLEYKPTDNSYIRLEARMIEMDAGQEIFHWIENEDSRTEILFHFGVSF